LIALLGGMVFQTKIDFLFCGNELSVLVVERSSTIERYKDFSKTGNDTLSCFIKQKKISFQEKHYRLSILIIASANKIYLVLLAKVYFGRLASVLSNNFSKAH
jgi:hypothetical protein